MQSVSTSKSNNTLASWTFLIGTLSPIALFSTTWLGPILGVVAVIMAIVALRRPHAGYEEGVIILGLTFGVCSVLLSWIGPGIYQVIWG